MAQKKKRPTSRSSRSRYSQEVQDEVIALYRQGYTIAEICDLEGFPRDRSTVSRWLHERGVRVRNPYQRKYPREEILEKLADGYTRKEIAEEYNCSLSYLTKLLKENPLPEYEDEDEE